MNDTRLEAIVRRRGVRLVLQFGSTVGGAEHTRIEEHLGRVIQ